MKKFDSSCGGSDMKPVKWTFSDGVVLKNGAPYGKIISMKGNEIEFEYITQNKYLKGKRNKLIIYSE
jgi:hypothetical protein